MFAAGAPGEALDSVGGLLELRLRGSHQEIQRKVKHRDSLTPRCRIQRFSQHGRADGVDRGESGAHAMLASPDFFSESTTGDALTSLMEP